MRVACVRCDGKVAEVGVLCAPCATTVAPGAGQLREHVVSRTLRAGALGWVVDGFGAAHPLAARTIIGRRDDADLVVLHGSISRDHAELRHVDGRWQFRDLGSRNQTRVDGGRVAGRIMLPEIATIRVGAVALCFVGRAVPLDVSLGSSPTGAAGAPLRFDLRGPLELCVIGPDADDAGGALMYRAPGSETWSELSLVTLEYQLLRALCVRARDADACLSTRQLAALLPFQTDDPTDDNVRQLVHRLRRSLDAIGVTALIESVPQRGYRLGWSLKPR